MPSSPASSCSAESLNKLVVCLTKSFWYLPCAQGCPWIVNEAALQQYRLFVDGTWPASLAAAAAGGELQLPSAIFTAAEIERCLPCRWLSDEHINFGMWLLQQRDAAIQGCLVMQQLRGLWDGQQGISCHFFNSYFFSKFYLDSGVIRYGAVRKWTLPSRLRQAGQPKHATGVLDCELVVAPCNLNNAHWVLVVADLGRRRILYLDPMGVSCPESWCCFTHPTHGRVSYILDRVSLMCHCKLSLLITPSAATVNCTACVSRA